jgi:hypothetical protein
VPVPYSFREGAKPGLISSTIRVPAVVPLLVHISVPCVPSLASKKRRLPTAVRRVGYEPGRSGLMSATITVPPVVPSLFHSSAPWTPSDAVK